VVSFDYFPCKMAKTHKGMVHLGAGLPGLLKSGYEHYSGVEEAVMRNIEACTQLSKKTKTSLGPNGMNKLVINHLEKVLVTSDAAVMCTELEVIHPAAKNHCHGGEAARKCMW
jgi:T-complex protein 1 subunit theta